MRHPRSLVAKFLRDRPEECGRFKRFSLNQTLIGKNTCEFRNETHRDTERERDTIEILDNRTSVLFVALNLARLASLGGVLPRLKTRG